MADFLKGDNRILSIKVGAVYVPIGCATGSSFNEQIDMIPTTTRANAGWGGSIPGEQNYTISYAGLQKKDPGDDSFISYDQLKLLQRSRALIEWKIESVTDSLIDMGTGYLSSISEQFDAGEVMAFEGQITGYGEPIAFTDTIAPTSVYLNPITDWDSDYVVLTWTEGTDNVGVTEYQIWRDGVVYDTVTSDFLTYTDVGVVWAAVYSYNIKAVDGAGNESGLSNKRIVTIPVPAGSPTEQFILAEDLTQMVSEDNNTLITES